ncbi:MAG: GNAT family N-acetyltransferase [Pseudomonadota bacterium]
MTSARIQKARGIWGKTLVFRDADSTDAGFILSLRSDPVKSKHLSKIPGDLNAQLEWLSRYSVSDSEAYFVIENHLGVPLGTVRIYDARGDSFCWGSWILVKQAPTSAAIESALMVYRYALEFLNFGSAHFQVHQENERVWRFHERFGAERISADEVQYEYKMSNAAIKTSLERYRRFLPNGIACVFR